MTSYVLDASALLAMILGEPGADSVWERRRGALLSAVNYAEVLSRLVRHGKKLEETQARLGRLELDLVSFDGSHAAVTASLVRGGKPFGLSLGDRACLGLGLLRGLPVLTAERGWAKLELGITVELIR